MDSCLAQTGAVGVEALIAVALVLIAAGVTLALRARGLALRGALVFAPLLLVGLIVGGAPAAPAHALGVDCPPAHTMPDEGAVSDDPAEEPGDDPSDVVCDVAADYALEGAFRIGDAESEESLSRATFIPSSGDLDGLVSALVSAPTWPEFSGSIALDLGLEMRSVPVSLYFQQREGTVRVDLLDEDAVFSPRGGLTATVSLSLLLPAQEGCERAEVSATLSGAIASGGGGGIITDPCEPFAVSTIREYGTVWFLQGDSGGPESVPVIGFFSSPAEDAAVLSAGLTRGELITAEASARLSDGRTIPLTAANVRGLPGGQVELELSGFEPDGDAFVTEVTVSAFYQLDVGEGCDPATLQVNFSGFWTGSNNS